MGTTLEMAAPQKISIGGKQQLAPKAGYLDGLPRWEIIALVVGGSVAALGSVYAYRKWLRPAAPAVPQFSTVQRQRIGEVYAHFLSKYPRGMTLKDLEDVYHYDHTYAKMVFRAIDKDNSGLIDVREWFMHRVALQNPMAAVRFAFEVWDEDKSGNLSFNEVVKMFTIYQRSHIVSADKTPEEFARSLFAECKKTEKDALNLAEFTAAIRSLYEGLDTHIEEHWHNMSF
eukprot:Amastigsp_a508488_819.p1 type:complete len:229 gc:universal Amastigsp_a508488_819:1-687(+)